MSETDSSRISSVLGYLRVYNGIMTPYISFEITFKLAKFSFRDSVKVLINIDTLK